MAARIIRERAERVEYYNHDICQLMPRAQEFEMILSQRNKNSKFPRMRR